MINDARRTVPERYTVSEPRETAGVVDLSEHEIARLAFQLWLDSGCPVGWDQEHWFRAEAILRSALAAKLEDLSRPHRDTVADAELVAECSWDRWNGHWEVWEREWGARWVWDVRYSGVPVLNGA